MCKTQQEDGGIYMAKIFRNMRIGMKIGLVIAIVLIIGLGTIMVTSISTVRNTTETDSQNRLGELANARATVVAEYFDAYATYFKGLATNPVIVDALSNPDDPEKIAQVQNIIDKYKDSREGMEGIFVSDTQTVMYCHTNRDAIGTMACKSDEDVQATTAGVEQAENNVYIKGIVQSSASGQTVAAVYAGVYNAGGSLLGFVGGGCSTAGLQEQIYTMDLNGYEDTQIYVINVAKNNYVFSPTEEEIGTEITPDDIEVVDAALANSKGVMEYDDGDGVWMLAYEYIPSLDMILYICDSETEIYSNVNSLSLRIMGLCIAVLLVSLLVVLLLSRAISKDLTAISKVTHELGTLDLTKASGLEKFRGRKDEVGEIAKATGMLTDAVRNAVVNLMQKADVLSVSSDDMRTGTSETANSMEHINGAAGELATTATSTAENVTDISMRMQDVQAVMEQSSNSANSLSEASANIRSTVHTGVEHVEQLKNISAQSLDAFNTIFQGIDNISVSSNKISDASDMIKSIAEQTNLLSLNASIEAARAGEAGKGFAVVADEIRNLSDQSAASVETINQMLDELKRNTDNAVHQSNLVKDYVARQQEAVTEAATSFDEIANHIHTVNDAIGELNQANQNLDAGIKSIADSISNLSAISEENAATAQELNATTEDVNSNVELLGHRGQDVAGAAEQLQEIVSVFKTDN